MARRLKLSLAAILLLVVLTASFVAHIPGPVPTSQAILQAQKDPRFLAAEASAQPPGSMYGYQYYTDDPGWKLACRGVSTPIPIGYWFHYIFPFHEYFTSTLVFSIVAPTNVTGPFVLGPVFLAAEVNPSTGQVVSISYPSQCA